MGLVGAASITEAESDRRADGPGRPILGRLAVASLERVDREHGVDDLFGRNCMVFRACPFLCWGATDTNVRSRLAGMRRVGIMAWIYPG